MAKEEKIGEGEGAVTGSANFMGDFSLRLVIKHPTMSLRIITSELDMIPTQGHTVGEPRVTPTGRKLEGVWNETFFGYKLVFRGRRDFFAEPIALARSLLRRSEFLRKLRDEGGTISIYIDIYGYRNFGDTIAFEEMKLFSSLGIDLGIELFPGELGGE